MQYKPMLMTAIVLAAAFSGAARAEDPMVIPENTGVPADDQKAIRAMLVDYLKAVAAGDREKALSFCTFTGKDEEKVSRLSCEIDFEIAKLRAAVEGKLGKDAWKKLGEMLAEMTPAGMAEVTFMTTENPDEVRVTWSDKSKIPEDKRITGTVGLVRVKNVWKFRVVETKDTLVETRRTVRDELAELAEISADLAAGKIKDAGELEARVAKLVKEMKGPSEEEAPGAVPVPMPAPQPPAIEP